jgi:hypothetical protein
MLQHIIDAQKTQACVPDPAASHGSHVLPKSGGTRLTRKMLRSVINMLPASPKSFLTLRFGLHDQVE